MRLKGRKNDERLAERTITTLFAGVAQATKSGLGAINGRWLAALGIRQSAQTLLQPDLAIICF
jgi:hypothetical protein